VPQHTDAEADVVVVGFGGAGATAAITAARNGASVIVVEKQPAEQHTPSSRMSGNVVMTVVDVDAATEYFDRCASGLTPLAVSRAWAERAATIGEWLEATGTGLELEHFRNPQHTEFEGANGVIVTLGTLPGTTAHSDNGRLPSDLPFNLMAPAPGGGEIFKGLSDALGKLDGVTVEYSSPARRLLRDESGRVCGVEVDTTNGVRRIGARRGVVLASGGFEFDEEMKANYLKGYPIHFYGNPGNTGDGIRMAQDVGAALWHMNQMMGRGIAHFPLGDGSVNFIIHIHPPGYVITDKYGERYVDETRQARIIEHTFYLAMLEYDRIRKEYTRTPSYWFFDQRRMDAGPLTVMDVGAVDVGLYAWSEDNSAEVERGWISRGDTPEEAARLAGVADPVTAARTIEKYNEACAAGVDELGRPAETLIPLDQPPYYCVPLYAGGPNTVGGPKRNEHSQVLDVFDEPIPGLYAAGELGAPVGLLYPASGAQLSEALCFGQIAVEHMLEEGTR
jgi:succinate dehydrogenase/fumarate reductase flavoprotein subunit